MLSPQNIVPISLKGFLIRIKSNGAVSSDERTGASSSVVFRQNFTYEQVLMNNIVIFQSRREPLL